MEEFVKGEVVVIPFPFSDLSNTKKRPATVIASFKGDDLLLCQITSTRKDEYSIPLPLTGFESGSLPKESVIRTNRLFTADKKLVIRRAGKLKKDLIQKTQQKIMEIIQN